MANVRLALIGDGMYEIDDARRALAVLESFDRRIEEMLSAKPSGTGTAQLIATTTQLLADIRKAKASAARRRTLGGTSRADDLFATAVSSAATAFKIKVDTDPSKPVWARELREVQSEFIDFVKRIRNEFPGA